MGELDGQLWGYARVSKIEQDLDGQLKALNDKKVQYIYCDKITGTSKNRPALDELIADIEKGKIKGGILFYVFD